MISWHLSGFALLVDCFVAVVWQSIDRHKWLDGPDIEESSKQTGSCGYGWPEVSVIFCIWKEFFKIVWILTFFETRFIDFQPLCDNKERADVIVNQLLVLLVCLFLIFVFALPEVTKCSQGENQDNKWDRISNNFQDPTDMCDVKFQLKKKTFFKRLWIHVKTTNDFNNKA